MSSGAGGSVVTSVNTYKRAFIEILSFGPHRSDHTDTDADTTDKHTWIWTLSKGGD
jgi:hypothetical protein